MSKGWLKPFSAGAILISLAWIASLAISREQGGDLVLTYTRNDGPHGTPTKDRDPGERFVSPTDYLVFIAKRCGLPKWDMASNLGDTDVPETAWMRTSLKPLTDQQLNCLTGFVRPVFVRLNFESAN